MSIFFDTHIKIDEVDLFGDVAIWPKNMEVCITRIPIRKRDGYSLEMVRNLVNKLKQSMVQNGKIFLICYAPSECKSRPFELCSEMVKGGFSHIDNIVVERTWKSGKKSENSLVNSHDYVLFFTNGPIFTIDREPVKHYLMQEDKGACCGNTWIIESDGLDDSYSCDMAQLILMFSDLLPGSAIFDPFMGNTSIIKACLKLGHSLIGFETNKRKLAQYEKVLEDYKNERK
jgi:hypothetical protein